jgi:hypothetical protein
MLGSVGRRSASEKRLDLGCLGNVKDPVGGGPKSDDDIEEAPDHWWDGYSLALTNGQIVETYSPAPERDRLAVELKN